MAITTPYWWVGKGWGQSPRPWEGTTWTDQPCVQRGHLKHVKYTYSYHILSDCNLRGRRAYINSVTADAQTQGVFHLKGKIYAFAPIWESWRFVFPFVMCPAGAVKNQWKYSYYICEIYAPTYFLQTNSSDQTPVSTDGPMNDKAPGISQEITLDIRGRI